MVHIHLSCNINEYVHLLKLLIFFLQFGKKTLRYHQHTYKDKHFSVQHLNWHRILILTD